MQTSRLSRRLKWSLAGLAAVTIFLISGPCNPKPVAEQSTTTYQTQPTINLQQYDSTTNYVLDESKKDTLSTLGKAYNN